MQLVKVLYCKLPTISKKLPSFPNRVMGLHCRPQSWEASVLLKAIRMRLSITNQISTETVAEKVLTYV